MAAARRSYMSTLTMDEVLAMVHSPDLSESEHNDSDEGENYIPSDVEATTGSDNDVPSVVELNTADTVAELADAESEVANAESEVANAEHEVANAEPNAADADQPKIKRRKRPAVNEWNSSIIKEKRLYGEAFKNRKGQDRPATEMGPPCKSAYCQKSSLRRCQTVNAEQRQNIFDRFWAIKSWEERRLFVHSLVNKVDIKQKKNPASRRNTSLSYHLKLSDATSIQVCKSFFSSTLGLPQRTASWITDLNNKPPQQPKTPKTGKSVPVEETDLNFLKAWFADLPSLPSHYCRNNPAYTNKKFLYPGTTKSNLYLEYSKTAADASHRVVGSKIFSRVFDEENLSVFIPRKDQCDVCVSAKHGNIDQAVYDAHRKAKDEARAQKSKDKEEAASNEKISVWTMDLQAVLLCPKTKASTMYYKTKLQVKNFTLYNLITKEGFCYVWDETEANLNSEVFAHLQYKHFENVLNANPAIEQIIIWSDGCGYQNRNTVVTNALLHLATIHNVTIMQKYLVPGHTQMECDSMHSTLEMKLNVCDIITPHDYTVIFQSARIRPSPYTVCQVYHNEIFKLNGNSVTSIRPGKRVGDPTVFDLRALKYNSEQIHYKLGFTDDSNWASLPQRITTPNESFKWVRFFDSQQPITLRKFKDLQAMKHVLPKRSHAFFYSLPHLEA